MTENFPGSWSLSFDGWICVYPIGRSADIGTRHSSSVFIMIMDWQCGSRFLILFGSDIKYLSSKVKYYLKVPYLRGFKVRYFREAEEACHW